MYTYLVYLMQNGVYKDENKVRCQTPEEANIVIEVARNSCEFEKYMMVVIDNKLQMPIHTEWDYFEVNYKSKGK